MSYPNIEWDLHSLDGWSKPKLKSVRLFMEKQKTFALMIIQNGQIVDQWGGNPSKKLLVHSCRKSFLSVLIGIHLSKINLSSTMRDINIDDIEPCLTQTEKNATVLDLLRARSGV